MPDQRRGYLGLWEDAATGPQTRALAHSALTNDAATEHRRAVLTGATAAAGVTIPERVVGAARGSGLALTRPEWHELARADGHRIP